ncbi:hypothetical protein BaRGS_00024500 [Batillaria attramentaria]|uniref:Uncharacterized protein n=1 Tax=Batillaria attramentaria TaxID=370345 RepID=A0ABD0KBA4_9CAEN
MFSQSDPSWTDEHTSAVAGERTESKKGNFSGYLPVAVIRKIQAYFPLVCMVTDNAGLYLSRWAAESAAIVSAGARRGAGQRRRQRFTWVYM